jgi:hypothetical protein
VRNCRSDSRRSRSLSETGGIWRLLAHLHNFDYRARMVPHLAPLAGEADFAEITTGEATPWLRYVRAEKSVAAG